MDSWLRRGGRLSGENFLEVVTVAGTVDSGQRHNILNSDGQPHTVVNILTNQR